MEVTTHHADKEDFGEEISGKVTTLKRK